MLTPWVLDQIVSNWPFAHYYYRSTIKVSVLDFTPLAQFHLHKESIDLWVAFVSLYNGTTYNRHIELLSLQVWVPWGDIDTWARRLDLVDSVDKGSSKAWGMKMRCRELRLCAILCKMSHAMSLNRLALFSVF